MSSLQVTYDKSPDSGSGATKSTSAFRNGATPLSRQPAHPGTVEMLKRMWLV